MIETLTRFFIAGGIFMIPLVACSIVSIAIILERGFALRRSRIIHPSLVSAIGDLRQGGHPDRLAELSADESTALARLVHVCLRNLSWTKYENTEFLQTKARAEISELDRGIVVLDIIVGIGPLLGLLGTVSGLITIFAHTGQGASIANQGLQIARGISEALHTTIAGLAVAIPSLIAHGIYTRQVDNYAVELESLCMDVLGKLYADAEDA